MSVSSYRSHRTGTIGALRQRPLITAAAPKLPCQSNRGLETSPGFQCNPVGLLDKNQ